MQSRSEASHRARVIASNNIMNALFMVMGAIAAAGLLGAGLPLPGLFAVAALVNAAVAGSIFTVVPEFPRRFAAWVSLKR
jgi:hypothetical protein